MNEPSGFLSNLDTSNQTEMPIITKRIKTMTEQTKTDVLCDKFDISYKELALALWLIDTNRIDNLQAFNTDEWIQSSYDDCIFENGSTEIMVCDDEEADLRAKNYIDQSVWAFNSDFLRSHMIAELQEHADIILEPLQEQCESGNEAIKAMIKDFDYFVEDAISADGRGHFLNSYDGEEYEQSDGVDTHYIYIMND